MPAADNHHRTVPPRCRRAEYDVRYTRDMPLNVDPLNEEGLVKALSRPYREDVDVAGRLDGDVIVLGAGGKMGPTLVARIARAMQQAGSPHNVYAVSRYSEPERLREIEEAGATAISADLMDEEALADLPACPNVIYLVGMKFGASGDASRTWALNAYLPGRVASRYRHARIVALSTGNVYPKVSPASGGCTEEDRTDPVGEYAQSCLGRERMFEYFSRRHETPTCLIRLNYAVEARYGVFLDIARQVYRGEPVSVEMGYVNTIWQGDANSVCFRALEACASPPHVLNVTGPDILRVRDIAEEFGRRFGVSPVLHGTEQPTAFLSDAARCHARFGKPKVTTEEVLDLVAAWVDEERETYGKPTRFEVRDGRF